MKTNPRTTAREFALQFLYQSESEKIFFFSQGHFSNFISHLSPQEEVRGHVKQLCKGTLDQLETIDALISGVSANWPLTRMPSTDRNILRLATYEILESTAPIKVILNEAIELAKKYGTEHSGAFVNGLLDRLASKHRDKKVDTHVGPTNAPK